jgi:hypothetical protein
MTPSNVVSALFEEFRAVGAVLEKESEISLLVGVDSHYRKALVISAASWFEYRITRDVFEFSQEISNSNTLIPSFVQNKGIARQYHTWFDWNKSTANSFFGLFGSRFRNYMENIIEDDHDLETSIRDFLELGGIRNRLAHENYSAFVLEKTSEEIFKLFLSAEKFVDVIPKALRECSRAERDGTGMVAG